MKYSEVNIEPGLQSIMASTVLIMSMLPLTCWLCATQTWRPIEGPVTIDAHWENHPAQIKTQLISLCITTLQIL
jgi:hypothetical protein